MNRLILIGNGFDLAHGLKTSYRDFIDDYWTKIGKSLKDDLNNGEFNDDCVSVKLNSLVFNKFKKTKIEGYNDIQNFMRLEYEGETMCSCKFSNYFLKVITENCSLKNWVDIENEFYQLLVKVEQTNVNYEGRSYHIENLNNDFDKIRMLLQNYLSSINPPKPIEEIKQKILRSFIPKDFSISIFSENLIETVKGNMKKIKGSVPNKTPDFIFLSDIYVSNFDDKLTEDEVRNKIVNDYNEGSLPDDLLKPLSTLLLTFNYTYTDKAYENDSTIRRVRIHGELGHFYNPIIFGYGDEIDDSYKIIEKRNDNDFLKYIKSIHYLNTTSYQEVLRFIQSDMYEVVIIGHSCGNSDRTLLNTIFEHANCASIKIYYYEEYEKGEKKDNYSDLVMNISRNFTDKKLMRARVVNKIFCGPLVTAKK